MKHFRIMTAAEQVAGHLRGRLADGSLRGEMPGVLKLEQEIGVNRNTLEAALRILEGEGWLAPQGAGRPRRIVAAKGRTRAGVLRVAILLYEESDRMLAYMHDLQYGLHEAGHEAEFASKTLVDLKRDVARVAALVKGHEADAWIVMSGTREILEWFAARPVPAFALFGRRRRVRLAGAGPDKVPAMREAVRRLMELGHRRIVLLAREERRKPLPGAVEQAFLDELASHGVPTGNYNLPDWDETPEGFLQRLDALFDLTPPTALIFDEVFLFLVAQQHLARCGMLAPDQVSLVCCDPDPMFDWLRPEVAHIRWDPQPVVRRILRWVENVARGKEDRRQAQTKAAFVIGGTIGRVGE